MKAAQKRRDLLFKNGKPTIRPAHYSDIRWMWAGAKRAGFKGTPEEFTAQAEPMLAQADKVFIAEDANSEFSSGRGPVGIFAANYDEWTLAPHVEWFPWAKPRNKLRCTVGFLQIMRYTRGIGCIKISSNDENAPWFKWLRRYLPVILVGKIPGGRADGDDWVFYVRGRRHVERIRRVEVKDGRAGVRHSETTASHTTV